MVGHYDIGEERMAKRWDGVLDIAGDARADFGGKILRAILRACRDVETGIWEMESTLSRHAPRCTCGWGGAMANGAARHKCNVGPGPVFCSSMKRVRVQNNWR